MEARRVTMRTAILAALLLGGAAAASGQSPATFEVADVHASPLTQVSLAFPARGGSPRDGIYRIWTASLADLIRMAYDVDADKIIGGPHWLELDRFDLVARVAPGTTRESARPMLQALLADRFGLVVTQESKAFPVLALARGDSALKVREASTGAAASCRQSLRTDAGRATLTVDCQSTSMAALAQRVSSNMDNRPVVDATGLAGLWDFTVDLPLGRTSGSDLKIVSEGIQRSTGLTLQSREVSLPVITVQRANRAPSPNPPAVTAAFPPGSAPEFEASVVKPSAPGAQPRRQILGGQLNGTAVSVRQMLSLAYQLPDNAPIAGPRTLDAPLWDFVAKISSQAVNPDDTDIDAITRMMQALLAQRFHLKAHFEDRPMDAPTLVAAGAHKLTKSDPDARTRCTRTSAQGVTFPAMALKCQNISLAEFAERLQQFDSEEFKTPVADQTQIDGRWDISLTYTPVIMARAYTDGVNAGRAAVAAQGGAAAANPTASDPTGIVPIGEAIRRQLGIRIEMRQRPVQVLVIDSMDDKPTDN